MVISVENSEYSVGAGFPRPQWMGEETSPLRNHLHQHLLNLTLQLWQQQNQSKAIPEWFQAWQVLCEQGFSYHQAYAILKKQPELNLPKSIAQSFFNISKGSNSELIVRDLLNLAKAQAAAASPNQALIILQAVQHILLQAPGSSAMALQEQITELQKNVLGQGSWQGRAFLRLSHLSQEIFNLKTLIPLYASSRLFAATKASLLETALAQPASWWNTGYVATVGSTVAAMAVEIPFFAGSARWAHQLNGEIPQTTWWQDLQSGALLVTGFKFAGFLSQRTLGALHGIETMGASPTRALEWLGFTSQVVPQTSLYAAMLGNHLAAASLGLAPHLNFDNLAVDAGADMLSLHYGMRALGVAAGPEVAWIDQATQQKVQALSRHAIKLGEQFGVWAITKNRISGWLGQPPDMPGMSPIPEGAPAYMIKSGDPLQAKPLHLFFEGNFNNLSYQPNDPPKSVAEALVAQLYQLSREKPMTRQEKRLEKIQLIIGEERNKDVLNNVMEFTDVLPDTLSDREVIDKFIERFPVGDFRYPIEFIVGALAARVIKHLPFLHGFFANTLRKNIEAMGNRYIMTDQTSEVGQKVADQLDQGKFTIVDILGEYVARKAEEKDYTDAYLASLDSIDRMAVIIREKARKLREAQRQHRANTDLKIPEFAEQDQMDVQLSLKLSSFCGNFNPLAPETTIAYVTERLTPILNRLLAIEQRTGLKIGINFDAEHFAYRDVSNDIFKHIFDLPKYRHMTRIGIVVQAYTKDALDVLLDLNTWSEQRARTGGGQSILIRLVKGANMDVERILAAQFGYDDPILPEKEMSDLSYNQLMDMLFAKAKHLRAGFGSHNLGSLARALDKSARLNIPIEIQMLFGMADRYLYAMVKAGLAVAVYSPVGDMMRGMAYLARRILENSSQNSFLRLSSLAMTIPQLIKIVQSALEDDYTKFKNVPRKVQAEPAQRRTELNEPYQNEAFINFVFPQNREKALAEIASLTRRLDNQQGTYHLDLPALIGRTEYYVEGSKTAKIISRNPANPSQIVSVFPDTGAELVRIAANAAASELSGKRVWAEWRVHERAEKLLDVAQLLRERRYKFIALLVVEAGKTIEEADKEVAEAIDFLEYYARDAVYKVENDPNYQHKAKGVAAIIAPWNFPLAILAGMSSEALVAGNPVLLKPAQQTPRIGFELASLYHEAGIPINAVQFVPGGRNTGKLLVQEPAVKIIAFTGSMRAGMEIYKEGTRLGKTVLAEMGGKNFMIVASDAHSDDIIKYTKQSKLPNSGQKCSADDNVYVLAPEGSAGDAFYERTVTRIKESFEETPVGDPAKFETYQGPLIDEDAYKRFVGDTDSVMRPGESPEDFAKRQFGLIEYAVQMRWGELILDGRKVARPNGGYYLGPTIFKNVRTDSPLFTEEYFGSVLNIIRVHTKEEALALANSNKYALTGGVLTRSRKLREYFAKNLLVGNLYLDRGITGANVGRQPFGGFWLSGVGAKAGGEDYYWQFVDVVPKQNTEGRSLFEVLQLIRAKMDLPLYYQPNLLGEVNKTYLLPRSQLPEDYGMIVVSSIAKDEELFAYAAMAIESGNRVVLAPQHFYISKDGTSQGYLPYVKDAVNGAAHLTYRANWIINHLAHFYGEAVRKQISIMEPVLPRSDNTGFVHNHLKDSHLKWVVLGSNPEFRFNTVDWMGLGKVNPIIDKATQFRQDFARPIIWEDPLANPHQVLNKLTLSKHVSHNVARHGFSHKSEAVQRQAHE